MTSRDTMPEFAVVVRGYDRLQVDDYVIGLRAAEAEAEARTAAAEAEAGAAGRLRRAAEERLAAAEAEAACACRDRREIEERLAATEAALAEAPSAAAGPAQALPVRLERMLALAEEEAAEIRRAATVEAAQVVEAARQEAAVHQWHEAIRHQEAAEHAERQHLRALEAVAAIHDARRALVDRLAAAQAHLGDALAAVPDDDGALIVLEDPALDGAGDPLLHGADR